MGMGLQAASATCLNYGRPVDARLLRARRAYARRASNARTTNLPHELQHEAVAHTGRTHEARSHSGQSPDRAAPLTRREARGDRPPWPFRTMMDETLPTVRQFRT
jgi:hypothetical protein